MMPVAVATARTRRTLLLDIEDLTDQQVDAIRSAVEDIVTNGAPDQAWIQGWTTAAAVEMVRGLRRRNRMTQAHVLHRMALSEVGLVHRSEVYALGGYSADRSLKGFTRPVVNLAKELVEQGLLAPVHAEPIRTVYDLDTTSFQQAVGFAMDPAIAPVFREAFAELEWTSDTQA